MRDLIEKIVSGQDNLFGNLIQKLTENVVYAFAKPEDEDELTLTFLNYLLEDNQDIEYIPVFTDTDEVDDFLAEADVPEGYTLYEFDGDLFAEIFDNDQFLMINPVSGGIVFQAAHLKAFADPANDDSAESDEE